MVLRRWWPRSAAEWCAAIAGIALAVPAFAVLAPLPDLDARLDVPGTVILDAHGGVIERDVAAGVRIPVTLDRVAPAVIDATVAAEDQRFWRHPGVDPLAIGRAALHVRSDPSGASTLTQQLARRAYLADDDLPLLVRKAREAVIAVALEARTSKEEVLEAYLNDVYYGRGAYGIEAAAQVYFGTSAARLDLAQASFLAGLPRSPQEYDASEDAARERQRYVLDRMVATGSIDADRAEAALATPLAVIPPDPPLARHVSSAVYDELRSVLPAHATEEGLVIETTIDPALQREAERSVRTRLVSLEDHRAGSAAVVALDPRDGRVLALVGSADYDAPTGQIDMALEPRQPGSALKPLLYAAAIERGYSPASMLLDVPSVFETDAGPYRPANYDLRFRGPVTMRVALASSLNVPAVRTLDAIGVDALIEMAHRAGLDSLDAAEAYGLSLTLGGGGVRLIDLAAAYGALAQEGVRYEPWLIARVMDHAGNVLYERPAPTPVRVLDAATAFLVTDMLSDPIARVPSFGADSILDTPFDAAVKTGTSSEFRDNWTIGYTPERVVGVWVGNPDQRPMVHISGVDGAAPIWRDVMTAALEGGRSPWRVPDGVVRTTVCAPTGLLPGPDCPGAAPEWFLAGTEPTATESYYERTGATLAINPPAEARAWAAAAGWSLWSDGDEAGDRGGVAIVSPAPGSVLYPAPEVANDPLLLRASVPAGTGSVEFYVNGIRTGTGTGAAPFTEWMMTPGRYELRVIAHLPGGATAEAIGEYEVRAR
ncbi:MAG: transglycosylase domain-containing protein [Dehalococcoidia bacterium]|nr:transglycosylase domain-containing protein [Dehalococcoidia bacterium]